MTTKSKLPFTVDMFDICNKLVSRHAFDIEPKARCKFKEAVQMAALANTGKVSLVYHKRLSSGEVSLDMWERTPVVPPETYVVHSVNTIDKSSTSKCGNRYKTRKQAIATAVRCVESWGVDHPGAVVFKAIAHVHRGVGTVVDVLD